MHLHCKARRGGCQGGADAGSDRSTAPFAKKLFAGPPFKFGLKSRKTRLCLQVFRQKPARFVAGLFVSNVVGFPYLVHEGEALLKDGRRLAIISERR